MILVLDAGNSNIVVACMDEHTGNSVFENRIHTDLQLTATEYAISIKAILDIHRIDPEQIQGGILSSSVPHITRQLKAAAEIILGKEIIEVGTGCKNVGDLKIDDPGAIGPDLLVGAVAGLSEYGSPLILIDMGTATTISVIDNQCRFLGGMILPGVYVSLNGLVSKATHLPQIDIDLPPQLINSTTVGAMQSGSIYGQAACIDGMVERIWEDLGYETKVVCTGGFSKIVTPCCKHSFTIDSQLLTKGLLKLYRLNA